MNIKSLLLGSAAALVAVSGARAADAIVPIVEPEPVEYVRVCDVYGAGFYYIPGTETCLSIGGYVRFQVNVAGRPIRNREGDRYQVGTSVRARLNFDAREETELGTLRAFARVQSTNTFGSGLGDFEGEGSAQYRMDNAYIQLGGLLMGYRDTLWSSGIGGLEDGLLTDTDLVVGDFNTNQINYTFAFGGLSATVGVEDDSTGDIVPDVHAKLVYSGAWGGAYLSAVYDETFNPTTFGGINTVNNSGFNGFGDDFTFNNFLGDFSSNNGFAFGLNGIAFVTNKGGDPTLLEDGNNDAFALKGGVQLKDMFFADSTLKVEGHYAFDPTSYARITGLENVASIGASDQNDTVLGDVPGSLPIILEYAIGAGYAQSFGDLGIAVSGQYGKTFETNYARFGNVTSFTTGEDGEIISTTGVGVTDSGEVKGEYFAIAGDVGYKLTNNFAVLGEVVYRNIDFDVTNEDQTSGFVRFQRDF